MVDQDSFSVATSGDARMLCAGLIGWRSLVVAQDAKRIGIYGFGAAGHIVAQVALWQGRSVAGVRKVHDHLCWVDAMSGMYLDSPEGEGYAKAI
jgi:D-arabinose 1-dehydrogenase-like Zn-dependent alcohol dehydrogenase